MPQVPEDYVHRIGRTARAGSNGSALTFLTRDDRSMWNSISKLIDPNFKSSQNNFKNNSSKNNRNRNSFDKKRNFKDKKKFFKKDDSRSSSFGDKKKYSGYTNNPNYFGKKPVENSSSINEKKDFGFKKKKKFKNRSSRPKNFTFKKHSQKRKEF